MADLRLLSRFKACISGSPDPEHPFMKHWVPSMIQDPLLMKIILFTSACFLNEIRHVPKTVVVALRGKVFQALNEYLRSPQSQTTDVSILAVTEMVLDEWYWGGTHALHAHMKGLRTMVAMRGGLQDLGMHGYIAKAILM
jgi:Fungal specific transcription factor domain